MGLGVGFGKLHKNKLTKMFSGTQETGRIASLRSAQSSQFICRQCHTILRPLTQVVTTLYRRYFKNSTESFLT